MDRREAAWLESRSRRRALVRMAGLLAASPLLPAGLKAQLDPRPFAEHRRVAGINEMLVSFDFEPVFFGNLSQRVSDYTAHGDGSEFTLRRNRLAFEWVDLLPGRPVDPKTVDLSSTLFGMQMKFPIIVAPSASMVALHPDGEIGMYRAATAASNTPMMLSQNTSTAVGEVGPAAKGALWWQFYPQQDLTASRRTLETAQTAGCLGVVVTVDQQASYYERTQHDRNLGGSPRGGGARGFGAAAAPTGAARYRVSTARLWYTWQYLRDIHPFVKGPLVVKGVLTAEDARLCVEYGADGIVVSNHGGRSMDYGPSTLEVLPEIVAAVGGRIPVLIDSGFRRGADILKALALGANAVMLGRATRWALGAFGVPGVERLLGIMQRELVEAAAAAGRTTLASIDRSIVRTNFI